jgi:hypothetical protein
MKTLKGILRLAMKLNKWLYLFDIGQLLQRWKNMRYYCLSKLNKTKMGCRIHISSLSLKWKQSYSIWQFATSHVKLLFLWWWTS